MKNSTKIKLYYGKKGKENNMKRKFNKKGEYTIRWRFRIIRQEISEAILRCRFTLKNNAEEISITTRIKDFNKPDMYIGTIEHALFLLKKGIRLNSLESPEGTTACIGYCPKEQKWYGWSHRAIYGFGVGSKVKKGDCAYMPADKRDFLDDCIRFWSEDSHNDVIGHECENDGIMGVKVEWIYSNDIPNETARGKVGGAFSSYPEQFGKGAWEAETIRDAKHMAIDFAKGVS